MKKKEVVTDEVKSKTTKKKKKFIEFIAYKPTKKELETQKKVKKLNRITKILGISLIAYIILSFINNIIMYFNEDYAYFYISTITNFKNGILFWLFSLIPYGNFAILVTFSILLFVFAIKVDNKKNDVKKRNKAYNIMLCVYVLFIYFVIGSVLVEGQYRYHLPNFDNLLFEETKDKIYTTQDLIDMNIYLKDKVIEYAHKLERDENGDIISNGNFNKIAANDLRNVSDKVSLLKGLYPLKSTHLNTTLKGLYGAETVGLTNMYSTYLDYNASPVSALNTITHEYCHTKGFIKENETVFCSFLAAVNSDNLVSNYSGYLEAFSRSNYALGYIDSKTSDSIEYETLRMCLLNNYTEFCDMYIKNNTGYIPGSEELRIAGYQLKDYKSYYDEFVNSLTILNENGARFGINGEETPLEDVITLLNNDSEETIYIIMDINSNSYKKIEDAIKNDKLYISIYQRDLDEEEPPEIENPTEFFLSPFPLNDEGLFNSLKFSYEDYTYERAARLFLEYFDKYGYN